MEEGRRVEGERGFGRGEEGRRGPGRVWKRLRGKKGEEGFGRGEERRRGRRFGRWKEGSEEGRRDDMEVEGFGKGEEG